jgi:hypothetical protein
MHRRSIARASEGRLIRWFPDGARRLPVLSLLGESRAALVRRGAKQPGRRGFALPGRRRDPSPSRPPRRAPSLQARLQRVLRRRPDRLRRRSRSHSRSPRRAPRSRGRRRRRRVRLPGGRRGLPHLRGEAVRLPNPGPSHPLDRRDRERPARRRAPRHLSAQRGGPRRRDLAGRRLLDDRSRRGASGAPSDRRRRGTLPHPLARSLRVDAIRLSLCADYLSRRGD